MRRPDDAVYLDLERPHVHVVKGGREYRVQLLPDEVRLMTMGCREKNYTGGSSPSH